MIRQFIFINYIFVINNKKKFYFYLKMLIELNFALINIMNQNQSNLYLVFD